MEFKSITFTPEQKKLAKKKLLEVSSILRKWESKIPGKTLLDIKSAFLNETPLVEDSDWLIDQNIINRFRKIKDPEFNEPVETAILRSFIGMCKKIVVTSSKRVSSQTKLKDFNLYEDLLQDAYGIVLNSMYYYSQENLELSTFIGHSLKNGFNRLIRYSYCVTSPISIEDNITKIQVSEIIKSNPYYTFDQIVESMKSKHGLDDPNKIKNLISGLVRENYDEEGKGTSLNNLVCNHNSYEEIDCAETVEILEKLFSSESKALLNLTDKEVEVLKFGFSVKFQRGWQSNCDHLSITRQRVSQIYESAIKKVRPFFAKVFN